MEVISSLDPNAPMFVPQAYRTVEDFSDEWWHLVHSSPCFRDYWLRDCFQDPQFLSDAFHFAFQDEDEVEVEDEIGKEEEKELVPLGLLKWRSCGAGWAQAPRYAEKAPKFVKPKVSPRAIHQPR